MSLLNSIENKPDLCVKRRHLQSNVRRFKGLEKGNQTCIFRTRWAARSILSPCHYACASQTSVCNWWVSLWEALPMSRGRDRPLRGGAKLNQRGKLIGWGVCVHVQSTDSVEDARWRWRLNLTLNQTRLRAIKMYKSTTKDNYGFTKSHLRACLR